MELTLYSNSSSKQPSNKGSFYFLLFSEPIGKPLNYLSQLIHSATVA